MTKKVLVIEDESDIATYLLAVLEDQGLSAQTLKNDAPLAEEAASAGCDDAETFRRIHLQRAAHHG
jgi:DNA-binding response OmpR family regulator